MKLVEIACFSDNVEKMAEFYKVLLGVEPVAVSEGMAIFMTGETRIFIHQKYTPGEGDLPPKNHIAFAVNDVDEVFEKLTAGGLKADRAPMDYYWGRSAYLVDPDGQQIEIIQNEAQ